MDFLSRGRVEVGGFWRDGVSAYRGNAMPALLSHRRDSLRLSSLISVELFLLPVLQRRLYNNVVSRALLIIALFCSGCVASKPELTEKTALCLNGRWLGPIWVSENPEFDEYAAAQSLADACKDVTGVRPEIRQEGSGVIASGPGIALGRTLAATKAGIVVPAADGDTAVRATRGQLVFLVGNNPTATYIATGRFCEQALGMIFVMPGVNGADFKPLREVGLPADEVWRPSFAWRSVSGMIDSESIAWARRVGYGERPKCTHGLYAALGSKPEFTLGVNTETPANAIRGRSAQPKLSHPQAAATVAAYSKEWFAKNPQALAVNLGINDSLVYEDADVAQPKGMYDGRPNRSDYVFDFLNKVAALDWAPPGDHAIGCLAYLDAAACPKVKVSPVIFPAICADRIQYANPEFAKMDATNLVAWGRSGARRIGIWDYWFGRDVVIPRVHLPALTQSIVVAHQAGVCSWFAELDPLWVYDAPKAWVGAKLLSDARANPARLAQQWFDAAYGPAAPAMITLYSRFEDVWGDLAVRRMPAQWLVGWRDGCSAAELLTPALQAAAEIDLAAAERVLAKAPSDARHNRMRMRLAQFIVVWKLSVAEAARSRLANAAGQKLSDEPLNGWQKMMAAELARDQAESEVLRAQWPGSLPVKWSASVQPNPWPLLAARLSPDERKQLVIPSEAPAAARIAMRMADAGLPRVVAWKGLLNYPAGEWTMRLAYPAAVSSARNFLTIRAPQGRLFKRVTVAPGEVIRVSVDADAAESISEGAVVLAVRFPETPKAPAAPKVLHAPPPPPASKTLPYSVRVWGRTVLEVPVGANVGTVAEVEIAFTDSLPTLREVTIERISLQPR